MWDAPIEPGKEYKFILTLSNSVVANVSGFIYDKDMNPCVNMNISAYSQGNFERAKTDYLGFFEISGMNVEKGTKIRLSTYYKHAYLRTNVLAGEIIEWAVPEPNKIIGKVYIDDIYNPATNFSIKINSNSFPFKNENFSLSIGNDALKSEIILNIFVPGFAPEIKKYTWKSNSNILDVGDIIIKNKPAEINGRVVDYDGYPVSARISLRRIIDGNEKEILSSETDDVNGIFNFKNLPMGTYYIYAGTKFVSAASEKFELHSDEIYTAPDLVIVNTNLANVSFQFVIPDGNPAANARISYFNKSTDENGFLKEKIRPGNYNSWNVTIGEDSYTTDKIKIEKYTEEITVNLIPIPLITGKVTLDNKPLDGVYLRFRGNSNSYSATVFAGKFELKAKSGKYIVTCRDKKVAAVVELSQSGENEINFKSGDATLEFAFSVEGNWNVNLSKKIDNKSVNIASYNSVNDSNNKITELPAGEYRINAYCRSKDFRTNISTMATLKSGEAKEIKL